MTRQIRDTLIFEGETYPLNTEIVEKFFSKFPEKRFKAIVTCSALWRGYVARFEIKNDELILNDIQWLKNIKLEMESRTDCILVPSKAEWYSGLVRIDSFGSEFHQEPEDGIFEYLEIVKGNFIQKRIFNYTELQKFKNEQYKHFMSSGDPEPIYRRYEKFSHRVIDKEKMNESIKKNIMRHITEVYI